MERADELREQWGTATGQHWGIGRHSLYCGSAVEISAGAFDGIVTDPPYDLEVADLSAICKRHADLLLVLASDRLAFNMARYWDFRLDLIWHHRKSRKIPTRNMPILNHAHVALFALDHSVRTHWQKPRKAYSSIIEVQQEYEDTVMGHGKAAVLFERMMEGLPHWKRVIDPFCGTGAVIIAAQNTGRECVGIEINPATCAVALQRCVDAGLPTPVLSVREVVDSQELAVV